MWYGGAGEGDRGRGKRNKFHYILLGDRELSLGM